VAPGETDRKCSGPSTRHDSSLRGGESNRSNPSGAPGPADLLASAFAACPLKNLARTPALVGFEYDSADIELTYRVRVLTDESERRVELAHVRKYGTIFNTLAAVYDVHGTVEAVARTEGDAT
jgi:uncharacterized OsmC-like protein